MREQDYPTGSDFSSSAIIRKLSFWIEQSERQNRAWYFPLDIRQDIGAFSCRTSREAYAAAY
jgi:hypothetical protein